MDILKPCPFCGSRTTSVSARYGRNGWFVFAQCEMCGAESKKIGIGRNSNISDNDVEFWENEKVDAAATKVARLWNMRRCPDAE